MITVVGQFVACTDASGKEISIITHGSVDKPILYSHKVTHKSLYLNDY